MTCGTCGATIADKAIICYRCGAPTSTPVAKHPQAARRRTSWAGIAAAGVAAAGLAAFGASQPFESPEQIGGLAGAAAALLGGGLLWWRGRR
ncbi:MAG: hypothetical protein IT184_10125 [Acidobacteria bacterium]|nr:hypothetical protein [Acidobacteriota bacterium]